MSTDSEATAHTQRSSPGDWLVGGGKMGQLIRTMDWSQTPLGPIDSWSASMRTTVSLALDSNVPIALAWGPHHTQIYNNSYWPLCGDKHPRSLGQDFSECWASAWPTIGAAFGSAQAGVAARLEDQPMFLDRHGYLEEACFTFSFSPIRDEYGQIVGLFHLVTETTDTLVGQRRTRTLRDLAAHGLSAQSLDDGLRLAALTLADSALDLPFALFYTLDEASSTANLVAQTGLMPGTTACPESVDLTCANRWPLAQVAASGTTVLLDDLRQRFGDLVCGPYPEPITSAFVHAITPPGHRSPACIMIAGVSTRLPVNEAYVAFYDQLAATVTTVIAHLESSQRRRAWAVELEQRVAERTAALVQTTSDLQIEIGKHREAEIALRRSEQQHRLLFDTMILGSMCRDRNGMIISMNPAAEHILGRTDDVLGRYTLNSLEHATLREDGSPFPDAEHPALVALRTGQAVSNVLMQAFNPREQSYRWINVSAVPLFNGSEAQPYQVYTIFEDITDRKHTEHALQRSVGRLRVLAEASRAFAEAGTDYQTLLGQIAQTSTAVLGDGCSIRMLSDDGLWMQFVALYDVDPQKLALIRIIESEVPLRIVEPSLTTRVFQSRQPLFIPVVDREQFRTATKPEHWALIERLGIHSMIGMPMQVQGQVIGVMIMYRHWPEQPPFDTDDLSLVQDLADRAALAIGNVRLLAQVQHELAERAQAENEIRRLNAELEQRVADRTADLVASNKELEAFSYSISHDLRAPLRAINGFARIILEEYSTDLPEGVQRYFELLRSNAQQMGRLIDDLLAFARLSRQSLNKGSVNVVALVQQCLDQLRAEQANRQVEITIGALPECEADPALLKQVWINLLTNALKYTRRRDLATLTIASRTADGVTIYFVKDNGVGFDMRYSAKLFDVFQRMHRAEDYEGTGVGLAIVQRIIQHHGGRIWAEAQIGHGATFYFTLEGAQP